MSNYTETSSQHVIENLRSIQYLLTETQLRSHTRYMRFNMRFNDPDNAIHTIIKLSSYDDRFKPLPSECLANKTYDTKSYYTRLFDCADNSSLIKTYVFDERWSNYDNSLPGFLDRVKSVLENRVHEDNLDQHLPWYNRKLAMSMLFKRFFNKVYK